MKKVRGEQIIACSASEIVEKVAVIEGHKKEQPTSVAQRCTRIYAECNPQPGKYNYFVHNHFDLKHFIFLFFNFIFLWKYKIISNVS